jgi:hypothetical protein
VSFKIKYSKHLEVLATIIITIIRILQLSPSEENTKLSKDQRIEDAKYCICELTGLMGRDL